MQQPEIDKDLNTMRVIAALTNTEVVIKEVLDEFILLTYDLPTTPEGNKARVEFLSKAHWLGAIPHTESVYLMPRTVSAQMAAIELARVGNVFVWIAQPANSEEARALTADYDVKASEVFKDLEERLERVAEHIDNERYKLASNMLERTGPMVDSIIRIATQRGSVAFLNRAIAVRNRYIELNSLLLTGRSSIAYRQPTVGIDVNGRLVF